MCICIISHIAARELAQLASFWQWNVKHAYNLRRGYNICAKFKIDCLKTMGEVDYTNRLPNIEV